MNRERVFELEERLRAQTTKWLMGLDRVAAILVRAVFMSLPYSDKITRTKKLGQPHVMFVSKTGFGKTDMSTSLALSIRASFGRVQGRSDVMPPEILGDYVLAENTKGERSIRFRPGKIFANIVVLDEVNRILGEARSAVLEGMEERSVTCPSEHIDTGKGGEVLKPVLPLYPLSGDLFDETGPRFFMVLTTQNPYGGEEGTHADPMAVLDRTTLCLSIERPSLEDEMKISGFNVVGKTIEEVTDLKEILEAADFIYRTVRPSRQATEYRARLLQSTDPDKVEKVTNNRKLIRFVKENIIVGASPRVNLHLEPVAQVWAFFDGMNVIRPEHVRSAAYYVIPHRLVFRPERAYKLEREYGFGAKEQVFAEIVKMVEWPKWT